MGCFGDNNCWWIILIALLCGNGNNGSCGAGFGGDNCWWIILLLLCCGCGHGNNGYDSISNGCGCGCSSNSCC